MRICQETTSLCGVVVDSRWPLCSVAVDLGIIAGGRSAKHSECTGKSIARDHPFGSVYALSRIRLPGIPVEVYQGMLPWRTFGFNDLAWNMIGVLLFLALLRWQLSSRLESGGS